MNTSNAMIEIRFSNRDTEDLYVSSFIDALRRRGLKFRDPKMTAGPISIHLNEPLSSRMQLYTRNDEVACVVLQWMSEADDYAVVERITEILQGFGFEVL